MAAAVRGNMLGQALCRPLRPAARGFCSAPWPNVTVADIQARVNTPRGRNPAGAAPLGHPLTEKARSQQAAARRTGYLQVTNQCGPSLLSQYFAYCVGTGRPYIAVSKFGDVVTVDVTPVSGFGKAGKAKDAVRDQVLARFQAELASLPSHQLVNRATKNDTAAANKQGVLGSNVGKPKETTAQATFALHMRGRAEAWAAARQLVRAACEVTGAATPEQAHKQREANRATRAARAEQLMLRKVQKHAAAPKQHRNIPPGALEAFKAALQAGSVTPVPDARA